MKKAHAGAVSIPYASERFEVNVVDFCSKMVPTQSKKVRMHLKWTPLATSFWKMNVDVTIKSENSAVAMVVKDSKGKDILFKTEIFPCLSPHVAKLKSLLWASEVVELRSWNNIVWSYDASTVVRDIINLKKPCVRD